MNTWYDYIFKINKNIFWGFGNVKSCHILISLVAIVKRHINFHDETLRSLIKEISRKAVVRVKTTKMEKKKQSVLKHQLSLMF